MSDVPRLTPEAYRARLTSPPPADDGPTMTDRGVTTPLTTEEWLVIAHLRQWCHLSTACPMCKLDTAWVVERQRAVAAERALEGVICG